MSLEYLLKIGRKSKSELFQKLINCTIRFIYCCDIPCQTEIGEKTTFGHNGLGCVIHKEAVIRDNCFIQHRVTIGVQRSGEGAPVLESNCAIGPGAIIIGNIRVGENAVVGAGAVVCKDVPSYAVVGGPPKCCITLNNTIGELT